MKRINQSSVNESKPGYPATIRRQLETPTAPEILPGSLVQEETPSPFENEKNQTNMFDLIKNVVHWKKVARVPEENIYNLHLKMHELFALHDDLCLMSEKINEIYGFELVTSITCGFVMTLFAFFFEIKVSLVEFQQLNLEFHDFRSYFGVDLPLICCSSPPAT